MSRKKEAFEDLGFAKIDYTRFYRRSIPEIIFSENKTTAQLKNIISVFKEKNQVIILSRLSRKKYLSLNRSFRKLKYFTHARMGFLGKKFSSTGKIVSVVTAGTSDLPVAEEAAIFLEIMGNSVRRIYDAGVAGVHRILNFKRELDSSSAIIVVAGMEAALPSLVAGITRRPIIGVPTSIGYGASLKGLSALLGMLNSCALGIGVVNIDSGLAAGYLAHIIVNNS